MFAFVVFVLKETRVPQGYPPVLFGDHMTSSHATPGIKLWHTFFTKTHHTVLPFNHNNDKVSKEKLLTFDSVVVYAFH